MNRSRYILKAIRYAVVFLFCLLFITPVSALSEEEAMPEITTITTTSEMEFDFTLTPQNTVEYIPDYIKLPKGGTPWEIFAKTKIVRYQYKDKDDEDRLLDGIRPEFSEDLEKLDGQTVLMQGYMFPLDVKEKQNMFLFGPFPSSCPYHYHTGPELVIEAHSTKGIKQKWEAINLKGTLELVAKDDEYNIFYRLRDVVLSD